MVQRVDRPRLDVPGLVRDDPLSPQCLIKAYAAWSRSGKAACARREAVVGTSGHAGPQKRR